MITPDPSADPTSPGSRSARAGDLAASRHQDPEADIDIALDLDAPAVAAPREARLRKSASLLAAGLTLLACQQELGPIITFRVIAGPGAVSDDLGAMFTAAYFTVFGVGLALLVVGLHRFASHVHALAVSAQER